MQWEISEDEEVSYSRGNAEERLETKKKNNGGAGKMVQQVRVVLCKCETEVWIPSTHMKKC